MDFKFQRERVDVISEGVILEQLEKAAKHFNYVEFGRRDFDKVADISSSTVRKHYGGSWTKGIEELRKHLRSKKLDLKPRPFAPNRIYSDREMFGEMERVWKLVGQRPSRNEWEISSLKQHPLNNLLGGSQTFKLPAATAAAFHLGKISVVVDGKTRNFDSLNPLLTGSQKL